MIQLPVWTPDQFAQIFHEDYHLIDVRSELEFQEGHIPQSINIPILNNEHRKLVGTCYKQVGREQAIALGEKLVSGELRETLIRKWMELLSKNNKSLLLCFRGGLRSQFAQQWCWQQGVTPQRIEGGYKSLRQFLLSVIEQLSQQRKLVVVSGATGAGKTKIIRLMQDHVPTLDLEKLAQHRGSAFGAYNDHQPSQVNFENQLAVAILKLEKKFPRLSTILVEDESRLIGRCVQPESFFQLLRQSPVMIVDEDLESRVENTLQEYVTKPLALAQDEQEIHQLYKTLQANTLKISKRLGGSRTAEILKDLVTCEMETLKNKQIDGNKLWIRKLLQWYYDPMYFDSLKKRSPRIIFQGKLREISPDLINQWSV